MAISVVSGVAYPRDLSAHATEHMSLGGAVIPRSGTYKMSALGDSISNRDSATAWVASGLNGPLTSGFIFNTQMVSNGAVQLVAAWAVAGYTIAQMYTTAQSNGRTLLQSAIADSSKYVAILAGTNDTYGASPPDAAADIFARLRDGLWLPVIASGKQIIAHTIPPQSPSTPFTSAQCIAAQQVNKLIRDYCVANGIMLVDIDAIWRSADGTNQGARTSLLLNESSSYIHPNETGGIVVGKERWRVMQQRGARPAPTDGIGLSSPYSIGANPHCIGSNASGTNRTVLGTGISGTGPHGWNVNRSGTSTATVTPSGTRDDDRDGNTVQIAITTAGNGEIIKVFNTFNGATYLSGGSVGTNLRENSKLYAPGQVKMFSNGLWYKTLLLGTTAGSEPGSLPTSIGGFVTDGTQRWMKIPELTPGTTYIRQVAEVQVTVANTANFLPYVYLKQYATGFANLAAGVSFLDNDGASLTAGQVAGSWGTVFGGALPGSNGYAAGSIPLNTKLRLQTPWVKIASDCAIIEPVLAFIGNIGTATVVVSHLDTQVLS